MNIVNDLRLTFIFWHCHWSFRNTCCLIYDVCNCQRTFASIICWNVPASAGVLHRWQWLHSTLWQATTCIGQGAFALSPILLFKSSSLWSVYGWFFPPKCTVQRVRRSAGRAGRNTFGASKLINSKTIRDRPYVSMGIWTETMGWLSNE